MGSDSRERKHKKEKKEKSSKRHRSRSHEKKSKKKYSNRSRSRSNDRYSKKRYDEEQKNDSRGQEKQENQMSKKFVVGEETEQERIRLEELQKKYGIQPKKEHKPALEQYKKGNVATLIEITVNNRLGVKENIKCRSDDTIGNIKKLVAAKTGTRPDKIRLQKWNMVYKDHITLADYEIQNGFSIEMYNN